MSLAVMMVILATVTLSAVAQVALKIGVSAPNISAQITDGGPAFLLAIASSPFVWLGLAIYGASMLAWLWVLSKVDVSVTYPFVGISFLLTAAMGWFVLHENITALRIAGTVLVIAGCILIARSAAP